MARAACFFGIVALAVLGEGTFAAHDSVNVMEYEKNWYHLILPRRQRTSRHLNKQQPDPDDLDRRIEVCADTPGWTDFFGSGCKWFEEKDAPGCPVYGDLWRGEMGVANDHCCYCKSISSNASNESTLSSILGSQKSENLRTRMPSTELSEGTILTRTSTLFPSTVPSGAPTKQFLPGELLLSNTELGIKLSSGLEAKLIASSGKKLKLVDGKDSDLSFHSRIDGAGIIDLGNRGYVYMSNSEETAGGVYGLHFNSFGEIVDYRNLLNNTRRNCGGGLTPWNSFISCEEWKRGDCWQVAADPSSPNYLKPQKTMIGERMGGRFESVATDDRNKQSPVFFATEDSSFGAMRRFQATSRGWNSLHIDGEMSYLLIVDDKNFEWTKNLTAARESAYAYYQNSEGISFNNGTLYFTTKSTQKMFVLDLESLTYTLETTGLNFQGKGSFNAMPDQVIGGDKRFLYLTESGGSTPGVYARDMYTGKYMTIFESIDGERYLNDETVGIAFSPDRYRMYAGYQGAGVLFEFRRTDNLPFP